MKIKAIVLENFRRYRGSHRISVDDFTTIIGKNDAGKSTILEALDIFFGGETRIDKEDLSRGATSEEIRIGVVFDEFPVEVGIDRGAFTSLAGEHLLNAENLFEVHRVYNTRLARLAAKTFASANHPSTDPVSNLLDLKNADLKALVREHKLEARCDLNNNPSMRRALYEEYAEKLQRELKPISLSEGDAASVWKSLEKRGGPRNLNRSDKWIFCSQAA